MHAQSLNTPANLAQTIPNHRYVSYSEIPKKEGTI